jgi:hypothetical protein
MVNMAIMVIMVIIVIMVIEVILNILITFMKGLMFYIKRCRQTKKNNNSLDGLF